MPTSPAQAQVTLPGDDDLLHLIAQGDRRAFATLYARVSPQILGIVIDCVRDRAQSEEVTQEIFLEFWQNASRFDASKGKAMTWMMTTARRRAIDRVRSSQASRDRDMRIGIRDQPLPYDHVAETTDMHFARSEIDKAMNHITAKQREVIELAYFASLTPAEISERLGVSASTIKTRLRDGLIALRRRAESATAPRNDSGAQPTITA